MDIEKKDFSEEKRKELADKGHALPDGSYPIENVNDLKNAIQSIGRAKNRSEVMAHIIRRAKALKATDQLPDKWKMKKFIEDVSNMIKAIGTSSSVNEERDERSVENYVRQSANTNTTNSSIGGNIVSNTTEPDPKGDIAVTKSFPTAGGDHLVGQETRPTSDVSVSDAPNNDSVVPASATIPSDATSAVSPSRQGEMNNPTEESIAKGATCDKCGQALPVEKADQPAAAEEIAKSATCSDCGKSMDLCDCMGKAVDEKETASEAAKETPADEKKEEMKKSIWGGAFAPRK